MENWIVPRQLIVPRRPFWRFRCPQCGLMRESSDYDRLQEESDYHMRGHRLEVLWRAKEAPPMSASRYLLVCREVPGTEPCYWTGVRWSYLHSEAQEYTAEQARQMTDSGLPLPPWLTTDVGWVKRRDTPMTPRRRWRWRSMGF